MQNSGKFKKKRRNFTQVSNVALKDNNLSLKGKGLYAMINSFLDIPDFTLYKSYLQSQCLEGDTAFDSTWKELKNAGYLKVEKIKGEKGTWIYEYELLDSPGGENPGVENPGVDNPSMDTPVIDYPSIENGSLKENNLNKTELNNTDDLISIITTSIFKEDGKAVLLLKEKYNMSEDQVLFALGKSFIAKPNNLLAYLTGIFKNWISSPEPINLCNKIQRFEIERIYLEDLKRYPDSEDFFERVRLLSFILSYDTLFDLIREGEIERDINRFL